MKRKKSTGEKAKEMPADKQAGLRAVLRKNRPTYYFKTNLRKVCRTQLNLLQ